MGNIEWEIPDNVAAHFEQMVVKPQIDTKLLFKVSVAAVPVCLLLALALSAAGMKGLVAIPVILLVLSFAVAVISFSLNAQAAPSKQKVVRIGRTPAMLGIPGFPVISCGGFFGGLNVSPRRPLGVGKTTLVISKGESYDGYMLATFTFDTGWPKMTKYYVYPFQLIVPEAKMQEILEFFAPEEAKVV